MAGVSPRIIDYGNDRCTQRTPCPEPPEVVTAWLCEPGRHLQRGAMCRPHANRGLENYQLFGTAICRLCHQEGFGIVAVHPLEFVNL